MPVTCCFHAVVSYWSAIIKLKVENVIAVDLSVVGDRYLIKMTGSH